MERFVNDPGTSLSTGCSNSDATITVVSASGYPTSGDFRIKIDDELMIVTAVSGAVWTVTRGAESTTAVSHSGGAIVNHVVSAGSMAIVNSGWALYGPPYNDTCKPSAQSFSWRNQGSATETANGDSLYLLAAAAGGDSIKGREITAPATPYTITAGMIPQLHTVNYNSCGLYFADNGTGKITLCIWRNGLLEIGYFTNATTYSSTPVSIGMTSSNSMIWLRLTDNGTNHIASWSSNGVFFHQIYSAARTTHLATPDRVGYYTNSNNATYPSGVMLTYWKQS